MAQNYTINSFQADHVGQSDLQNMENNFECLRSMFSGASAPSNAVAGMPWFDTAQNLFKIRNDANSAWYGVMCGDVNQKMLVYRNTAMDGWAIDSGVTDRVIAVKGGATYTTGGAVAGSWTLPSHALTIAEMPAHDHDAYYVAVAGAGNPAFMLATSRTLDTSTIQSVGGGNSHNHGATYRPAAAVCTIQYPDI